MSFFRRLQFKIRNRWYDNNLKRSFLLLLFWITISCLFIPMMVISFVESSPLFRLDYMWIYYLFLPVSVLSIVLGKKYKRIGYRCTKNIVVGFIVSFILVISGSFTFIFASLFNDDYSYVNNIEKIIKFDLPDKGVVKTIKSDKTYYGNFKSVSTSYVKFSDDKEVKDFIFRIDESNKWFLNGIDNIYFEYLVPEIIRPIVEGDAYIFLYVDGLDNYNSFPTVFGDYDIYYLTFDIENKELIINYYIFNFEL